MVDEDLDNPYQIQVCPQCGVQRPGYRFSHQPYDTRCDFCYVKDIDKQTQTRLTQDAMAELFKLGNASTRLTNYRDVLAKVIDRHGSVDGFVDVVVEQLRMARQRSPGSSYVVNAHLKLLNIVIDASKHDESTNLSRLNNDELRDMMASEMVKLVSSGTEQQQMALLQAFTPELARIVRGRLDEQTVSGMAVPVSEPMAEPHEQPDSSDSGGDDTSGEGCPDGVSPVPPGDSVPHQSGT